MKGVNTTPEKSNINTYIMHLDALKKSGLGQMTPPEKVLALYGAYKIHSWQHLKKSGALPSSPMIFSGAQHHFAIWRSKTLLIYQAYGTHQKCFS